MEDIEGAAKKDNAAYAVPVLALNDGETVLRRAIRMPPVPSGGIIKYCWEKEVEKDQVLRGLSGEELAFLAVIRTYRSNCATETPYGYDVQAEFHVIRQMAPASTTYRLGVPTHPTLPISRIHRS